VVGVSGSEGTAGVTGSDGTAGVAGSEGTTGASGVAGVVGTSATAPAGALLEFNISPFLPGKRPVVSAAGISPTHRGWAVRLYVLDPHTIYRRGLAACLERDEHVREVGHAGSVSEAWDDPALFSADVVLVDDEVTGGREFVTAVREATGARVIVCTSDGSDRNAVHAIQAGAVGFLRKDGLSTEALASAVAAAYNGSSVMAPDLLGSLLGSSRHARAPSGGPKLTDREHQVLALIAEGHATREVAERLCYSERTVKNVLHDVVTKMGARSRSQAVAHAVREGLI
jgi:DNA-binding NarL/FixJ family response regulator